MTVEVADDEARALLGPAYPALADFARLLESEGELRGLIGPREVERLWSRHIVNSAAVVRFVAERDRVADLGSGGGFPGVVVAAMCPRAEVHLIEPMERRVAWLSEVVAALSLDNAVVHRGRAEDLHGRLVVGAVTARAVAPLGKLARWAAPLVESGGALVALKGERAGDELKRARKDLKQAGFRSAIVHEVGMPMSDIPARVVVADRS